MKLFVVVEDLLWGCNKDDVDDEVNKDDNDVETIVETDMVSTAAAVVVDVVGMMQLPLILLYPGWHVHAYVGFGWNAPLHNVFWPQTDSQVVTGRILWEFYVRLCTINLPLHWFEQQVLPHATVYATGILPKAFDARIRGLLFSLNSLNVAIK